MKFKVAQAVGLNTDQKAAQVTSSTRDEENVFLGVLQLTCDDAFTRGRQTLSELEDFYYEAEGSVPERINATLTESQKLLTDAGEYDLALAVVVGKTLYLIGQGEVFAYLRRNNKLSALVTPESQKQLISGFLQDGDRVFLSTSSLTSFLGADLNKNLELALGDWEDEMSLRITSEDLSRQGLAGLLLDVVEEEQAIPTISSAGQSGQSTASDQNIWRARVVDKLSQAASLIWPILSRVNRLFPRSGRGRLILGVILITVVLAGVGVKWKSDQEGAQNTQFKQLLTAAQSDFAAAQNLQVLNPVEAKVRLDSSKNNLSQALAIKPGNKEALSLKETIEREEEKIIQQFATHSFPLFLDTNLIKEGFTAKKLSLSDNKILLLDLDNKTLVVVDLNKKSNQVLAGQEQLGNAQFASLNAASAYIFSEDKGVIKVDVTNQKRAVISEKGDFGQVVDIAGFASNVYLLDSENNQIWKYVATASGYSDKREYLNKGVKADFSRALRMQIESSIYVLKEGGEILRYTRGAADNFALNGLDKPVKDPKSFFVSSDTDNLYLLDSGNSRLLVLSKTGGFKGQYEGEKFAAASDLVVDEKGKKAYLLEGSKIYQVDLK